MVKATNQESCAVDSVLSDQPPTVPITVTVPAWSEEENLESELLLFGSLVGCGVGGVNGTKTKTSFMKEIIEMLHCFLEIDPIMEITPTPSRLCWPMSSPTYT